jgi:Mlc titration factor MtfA (ptsG expression regulator)
MLNGEANGIPAAAAGDRAQRLAAGSAGQLRRFLQPGRRGGCCGQDTVFDPYAAENPGEFFAVMSEAFFETPDLLRDEYPAFYAQLTGFYRQDPASRCQARKTTSGSRW